MLQNSNIFSAAFLRLLLPSHFVQMLLRQLRHFQYKKSNDVVKAISLSKREESIQEHEILYNSFTEIKKKISFP